MGGLLSAYDLSKDGKPDQAKPIGALPVFFESPFFFSPENLVLVDIFYDFVVVSLNILNIIELFLELVSRMLYDFWNDYSGIDSLINHLCFL